MMRRTLMEVKLRCPSMATEWVRLPATCSTADDYEFIATLIDRSGNPSAEVLLVWDG